MNRLDRKKKYFTISINDYSIMEDLKDLDIIIFSASKGKVKSVPIPLLVEPIIYTERDKYYLFSFVGSILGRSKIREKLLKLYNKNHIITVSTEHP